MIVGILSIEVFLPGCSSLKEKRQIVQSLRTRIQNRFNASVAEVGYLDKWQRAALGVSFVHAHEAPLREVSQKIRELVSASGALYVLSEKEWFYRPDSDEGT